LFKAGGASAAAASFRLRRARLDSHPRPPPPRLPAPPALRPPQERISAPAVYLNPISRGFPGWGGGPDDVRV
jgi:hypothetical protein